MKYKIIFKDNSERTIEDITEINKDHLTLDFRDKRGSLVGMFSIHDVKSITKEK